MIGRGWAELAAAMGPPPVVMGRVLIQDGPQMPLAEDQHPVGDLGPGGEHEPFRISVRFRAAGRDLHGLDTSLVVRTAPFQGATARLRAASTFSISLRWVPAIDRDCADEVLDVCDAGEIAGRGSVRAGFLQFAPSPD